MSQEELAAAFDAHPTTLAPLLLGCRLTVAVAGHADLTGTEAGQASAPEPVTVRLTEVEAYGDEGEDPGAHSFRGRTERNAALFGPTRHTYVYLNYGIHRCVNLVAHEPGRAGGVLLRGAEVLDGRPTAVCRRGRDTGRRLLSGPGNLGQGLGITLSMGHLPVVLAGPGEDVQDALVRARGELWAGSAAPAVFVLAPPAAPQEPEQARVRTGPRVGVSGEGGSTRYPWRFWLDAEPSVTRYRPGRNVPA